MISFRVIGIPRPGGSKTAFRTKSGHFIVTDACKHNKTWRQDVSSAFLSQVPKMLPLTGQIDIKVTFFMPRPKAHYNSKGQVKSNAPHWHTKKPDVLKLQRSTEDALTKLAWLDDAQICKATITKVYTDIDPGAFIEIFSSPS